jgi:hypothetical protein
MNPLPFKMYLVLGDPSCDGHGISEKILLESNLVVEDVQKAYKTACKLTGISFNHNDDFTGIERDYLEAENYRILTEYENRKINDICLKILEKHGIDVKGILKEEYKDMEIYIEEHFVDLWCAFTMLGMKEENLIIRRAPRIKDYPTINDSNKLCCPFGYGLYN